MHDRRSKPRKVRALVVDDHLEDAARLCSLLQVMGCDTVVALGGESAIQVSKTFRPQLAIVDVDMPGAVGYRVATELREALPLKPTCIAFPGSGSGEPSDKARFVAAGFDRFIPTPMDPTVLATVLEQCRSWWATSWCRVQERTDR
jgi:CheY-like chemotaxis protein